jgi:hypothetical protein
VGSDGSRKYDESATECHIDWSCGLDPCVAFYANLRAAAVDGGRRDVEKEKRVAMSRKRKGRRCREREKGSDVEKEKRAAMSRKRKGQLAVRFMCFFRESVSTDFAASFRMSSLRGTTRNFFSWRTPKVLCSFWRAYRTHDYLMETLKEFLENPDHHQISPIFFHVALEQREFFAR